MTQVRFLVCVSLLRDNSIEPSTTDKELNAHLRGDAGFFIHYCLDQAILTWVTHDT